MKFGGTSVEDPAASTVPPPLLRDASPRENAVIVVSAMARVTEPVAARCVGRC
jgi:aspartokinase